MILKDNICHNKPVFCIESLWMHFRLYYVYFVHFAEVQGPLPLVTILSKLMLTVRNRVIVVRVISFEKMSTHSHQGIKNGVGFVARLK